MEYLIITMVIGMKEILTKEKRKAKEFICILMVIGLKDNLKLVSIMDREIFTITNKNQI